MDIHGVGRVTNKNYASEVGIPHCELSRESCSRYHKNNVHARKFDNVKKNPLVTYTIMDIKLGDTLDICNQNVSKIRCTCLKPCQLLI